MGDDRLDLIECLERVADAGSMAAAARSMKLTTAAVSLRVARLEEQLGVELLERHSRGIRLTAAGREYAARAGAIRRQLDEIDELVASGVRDVEGEVRLDVSSTLAQTLLLDDIARYLNENPKLRLHLHATDALSPEDFEGVDLAIRVGPFDKTSRIARKICRNRRILVASPDYVARHGSPLHPSDLKQHRTLALEWRQNIRLRGPGGEELALRMPTSATCTDGTTLTRLACLGVGIALKSTWDVVEQLRARQLVRVVPEWEESETYIYALFRSRRYQPPRVRKLLEYLVARLSARVTTIDSAY